MYEAESVDVVVIGGGHAGCEAALAAARMHQKTVLFAISLDSIAMMPCNPSIGGSSKGHLVKEIDALGGEMGKVIDQSYIQSKMLNTGKGPAVYSLRAQADKVKYQSKMKHTLEKTENLQIRQSEIIELLFEEDKITGVITASGAIYRCKAVVLAMGTYMDSRCLHGEVAISCGPNHLMNAKKLSEQLRTLGVKLYRFKTGTPARMLRTSLDLDKMEVQYGDEKIVPFSFTNTREDIEKPQGLCYLTYTNEQTHQIIKDNLHRSPLYSGVIEGTGPRYCPSIEDKVVRFSDKNRHQLFVEPEGDDTEEMYIQGMSSSLPEDVQIALYRTILGLEHCEITRFAYAIEYDCIDATELLLSLQFKKFKGLFSAGQFNGSSGYEEAAAQGLVAGINSVRYIEQKEPLILKRSDGYIGVLIDDLVSKGTKEPYRMLTSRAEFRLLLRQDNADQRLTPLGYDVGLIAQERYDNLLKKQEMIAAEIKRLQKIILPPNEKVLAFLSHYNSSAITSGVHVSDLLKRPELTYEALAELDENRVELPEDVKEQVNIQVKYEGYIAQQEKQVEQFQKLEKRVLPPDFDYEAIHGLRIEAKEKLMAIAPTSLGQASRISGVSPADISVLLIFMEQEKQKEKRRTANESQ
ncbi:MAG: tRNA uridine-5-carboxymethylaminomethyl(34) synthesis enzyme MnmG [Bacillota bacterium]